MMRWGRIILWAALAALVVPGGARGDVVIVVKGDDAGKRAEGEVTVRGEKVTVRPKRGRSQTFNLGDVRVLRTSTNLVDRFLADPNGRDLLLLASRAGLRVKLDMVDTLAKNVKVLADPADPLGAAEKLLERMKLTPKHTAEAVEKNVVAFEKEFKVKRYESESDHYFVLTSLGNVYAMKIAARMNGIFREYEKRLVFKEKIKDRFVVKVYANRAEYLAHGAPPGSAAYFSPGRRELVGYKQNREAFTWRSLYHEGMHQFLHFHIPNPPIWFDEGLAKYFENATPMRGIRRAGVPSYKVGGKDIYLSYSAKQAARAGNLIGLKALTEMSHKEWRSGGEQKMHLNYSQSWAFTHFLIESGNPMLKKLWTDYFFTLRDGADQDEVNKKVFGRANWPLFERMFKTYVGRL